MLRLMMTFQIRFSKLTSEALREVRISRQKLRLRQKVVCVIHRDVHCDRQPQCGVGCGDQEVELLNLRHLADALTAVSAVPLSH